MFEKSEWKHFCINLHADITTIRKCIPPGVKIEIDLENKLGLSWATPDFQLCQFSSCQSIELAQTVQLGLNV